MSGFYSVETDGWKHVPVSADVNGFSCLRCSQHVDVILGYGPTAPEWATNVEFLAALNSDSKRRRYVEGLAEGLKSKGRSFQVLRLQVGELGGMPALQYNARIYGGGQRVLYISVFSVVQKQRLLTVQVSTLHEPLTSESLDAVSKFLVTLTLEK